MTQTHDVSGGLFKGTKVRLRRQFIDPTSRTLGVDRSGRRKRTNFGSVPGSPSYSSRNRAYTPERTCVVIRSQEIVMGRRSHTGVTKDLYEPTEVEVCMSWETETGGVGEKRGEQD